MTNILQEIEEDLERQKMEYLWKRYGQYVYALAFAIIIGAAAITAWNSWRTEKEQKASSGLLRILENKEIDKDKEIQDLETFAQKNHGEAQAILAQLYAADLTAENGDKNKAVTLYDAVANNGKVDPAFRQLADLLAVQTLFDSADPVILEKRLQPLLADNAPWRLTAKEYVAFLALRAGDKAKAKQLFTELSQEADVPQNMSERANDMLRSIGD